MNEPSPRPWPDGHLKDWFPRPWELVYLEPGIEIRAANRRSFTTVMNIDTQDPEYYVWEFIVAAVNGYQRLPDREHEQ
jgi:hypothetical protein